MLNNDKVLNSLLAILVVLGLGCIGFVLYKNYTRVHKSSATVAVEKLTCVKETYVVDRPDKHMAGALKKKQSFKVFTHYFECNPVERNDFVFFNVAEGLEPVIRIIRGLPGDSFSVDEISDRKGDWAVSVNGHELLSDDGTPYFIHSDSTPALKAHETSRSGKLGDNEYIVLSKVPPGQSDSSTVGLVRKSSFIGKAVIQ